jgi:hypothetical protein
MQPGCVFQAKSRKTCMAGLDQKKERHVRLKTLVMSTGGQRGNINVVACSQFWFGLHALKKCKYI